MEKNVNIIHLDGLKARDVAYNCYKKKYNGGHLFKVTKIIKRKAKKRISITLVGWGLDDMRIISCQSRKSLSKINESRKRVEI